MSIKLKIKNKHLAEESKIIRFHEKKCLEKSRSMGAGHKYYEDTIETYHSLREHRKGVVAFENRATGLARAFLKGQSYKKVENGRKPEKEHDFRHYVLPRLLKMVNKYGDREVDRSTIEKWVSLT